MDIETQVIVSQKNTQLIQTVTLADILDVFIREHPELNVLVSR